MESRLKPHDLPDNTATPDDVRQAIEALSKEETYRLRKAADILIGGTEYQASVEIINEAIVRTISAANGGNGRRWPKDVPFMAYMIQTIKGLANDSRESSAQTKTDHIEAMAVDGLSAEEVLGRLELCHPDIVTTVIEFEETQERQDRAKSAADKIDAHFSGDSEITWIIMGHKDGQSPAEIRELAEMTETQYNSARRRFRRGLEKLFPGRRPS